DFGLAKLLERTAVSNTGVMTVHYAAPECFQRLTTRQSDQYSLAVTYCKMRGGRLPFQGGFQEIINGHRFRQPDLTMLSETERPVLARALAKEAGQRWPSCRAFVEALAAAALTREQPTAKVELVQQPCAKGSVVASNPGTNRTSLTPRERRRLWTVLGVL